MKAGANLLGMVVLICAMNSPSDGTGFRGSGHHELISGHELPTQFCAESRLFVSRVQGILPMELTAKHRLPHWAVLESGRFIPSV